MDGITTTLIISQIAPYAIGGILFTIGSFVGFKKVKKLIKDKRTKLIFEICTMIHKEIQIHNDNNKMDENKIIKHIIDLKNVKLSKNERDYIRKYIQNINKK